MQILFLIHWLNISSAVYMLSYSYPFLGTSQIVIIRRARQSMILFRFADIFRNRMVLVLSVYRSEGSIWTPCASCLNQIQLLKEIWPGASSNFVKEYHIACIYGLNIFICIAFYMFTQNDCWRRLCPCWMYIDEVVVHESNINMCDRNLNCGIESEMAFSGVCDNSNVWISLSLNIMSIVTIFCKLIFLSLLGSELFYLRNNIGGISSALFFQLTYVCTYLPRNVSSLGIGRLGCS